MGVNQQELLKEPASKTLTDKIEQAHLSSIGEREYLMVLWMVMKPQMTALQMTHRHLGTEPGGAR